MINSRIAFPMVFTPKSHLRHSPHPRLRGVQEVEKPLYHESEYKQLKRQAW